MEEPSEYMREYWTWARRTYGYAGEDERMESGEGREAEDKQEVTENKPVGTSWLPSLPVNLPWPFKR
jgi:hypothetical protein